MTGDLTTLANVKAYLGLTATGDDVLLGNLITGASAWLKSVLNRDIVSTTYTETISGTGTSALILSNYPVTAVGSLAINGVAVAPSAFVFDDLGITLLDGAKFPYQPAAVSVTYTAGFVDVPWDIAQACVEIVAWRYKEKDRIGHASKSVNGEVVAFQTTDVPADVKTLISNWRKVWA